MPGFDQYRLKVIEVGLKLETKGLKHSRNAVSSAARKLLKSQGIKVPRDKVRLYERFKEFVKENKNAKTT